MALYLTRTGLLEDICVAAAYQTSDLIISLHILYRAYRETQTNEKAEGCKAAGSKSLVRVAPSATKIMSPKRDPPTVRRFGQYSGVPILRPYGLRPY